MTRLDLILVVTIALVAFALGASLGPSVAASWKRPIAPVATYELRQRVPQHREVLATLERRRTMLRDRIAREHVAQLVPGQDGQVAKMTDARRRMLGILYAANADITSEQGAARVALAKAERRSKRDEARDRTQRRWEDRLGRAVVALGALGVQIAVLAIVSGAAGTPVTLGPVVIGSLIVLAALLLGEAFGWVAAIALAVMTATLLVGRRTA